MNWQIIFIYIFFYYSKYIEPCSNIMEILSQPPLELELETLTSSAEFVQRRRTVEILPTETAEYGSISGNYRCSFNIGSSGTEWLDGINSYFRLNLNVNALSTTVGTTVQAYLDEGGIHGLIKNVWIQLRNGTRIESIEDYNKLYAMISNATMSPSQVESVESMQSGDSMSHRPYLDPFRTSADVYNNSGVLAPFLPATSLLTVADVPDATDVTGANARIALARLDDGNLGRFIDPARKKNCIQNTEHVLTFKLMSNFLNHFKYLPLPMLQQLQIVIEFERPSIGLFMDKYNVAGLSGQNIGAAGVDSLNYSVKGIRYIANMVEPDQSIVDKYMKAWKSDGVSLSYQTYKRDKKSINNAAVFSGEIPVQYHSVRHILVGLMPDTAFVENGEAFGIPSNSVFRKYGLTNFIFKSGALRFPDHGPIQTDTIYAPEAFTQLMLALNQHNNKLLDTRIRVWEWDPTIQRTYSGVGALNQFTDATKFIIGVDTSRHNDFTGLDTTGQPIQVELNFTANVNCNVLIFTCYDSILTLSSSGAIVRT